MTREDFDLLSFCGTIINDSILLLHAKQNKEFSLEDMTELMHIIQEFQGRPFGFIIDKNQSYSLSTDMLIQGREVMMQMGVKAIAYFSTTMSGREASKLEINIVKNYIPAELFDTEEAAIDWISEILPNNKKST